MSSDLETGSSSLDRQPERPASPVTPEAVGAPRTGVRDLLRQVVSYIPGFRGKSSAEQPVAHQEAVPSATVTEPETPPEEPVESTEFVIQYAEDDRWNPSVMGAILYRYAVDAGMKSSDARNTEKFSVAVDVAQKRVVIAMTASPSVTQRFEATVGGSSEGRGLGVNIRKVGDPQLAVFPRQADRAEPDADAKIA